LIAEVPSKEICNSNARSPAEKNEHQKLEAECHLWKLHMFNCSETIQLKVLALAKCSTHQRDIQITALLSLLTGVHPFIIQFAGKKNATRQNIITYTAYNKRYDKYNNPNITHIFEFDCPDQPHMNTSVSRTLYSHLACVVIM
jgi:hypothetical protein